MSNASAQSLASPQRNKRSGRLPKPARQWVYTRVFHRPALGGFFNCESGKFKESFSFLAIEWGHFAAFFPAPGSAGPCAAAARGRSLGSKTSGNNAPPK